MARVLVVEDSPTQTEQIKFLLEDAGLEVLTAGNGLEALQAIQRSPPDIVVTDLEMPEMNGLELVEAVRRDHPTIPVVLMTAHGSEEIAALALRKGASSYVPKVYMEEDIGPTVEHVLAATRVDRHHQRAFECLTQGESHFLLHNDPSLIRPLIGYLEELLARLDLCDRTEIMRVSIALQEALLNAIDHGNLEVSSELRQQDETQHQDLVRKRRQEKPYRDRRVHVSARISPGEVQYVIRDEGPGYDPSRLPDPTDPANLERIGGRGLLLIRTFMDAVHHNPAGNEITMVKRRER
jgi:CheY-like chemotaxis protein